MMGKRSIIVVVSLALASTLTVASARPALAASPVYLGSDVSLGAYFDGCNGEGGRSNTGGGWKWSCSTDGTMDTYATAVTFVYASSDAHARAWVNNNVDILRRCAGQNTSLPGDMRYSYGYAGRLFVDSFGLATFDVWASPGDGAAEVNVLHLQQGSGGGNTYPSGFRTDAIPFAGTIGTTLRPKIRAESQAHSYIPAGAAVSDFMDGDRRTWLSNIFIDWRDASAPIATVSVSAARSYGTWHSSPASASIRARDPESCTKSLSATLDGSSLGSISPGYNEDPLTVTVSGTGYHTVGHTSSNYQNASGSGSSAVNVDATEPAWSDANVQCEKNALGNCKGSATVTFSCGDNHSGCDANNVWSSLDGGTPSKGRSRVVTTAGDHTIEYWAEDNVGNLQSTHNTVSFRVDCAGILPPVGGICTV